MAYHRYPNVAFVYIIVASIKTGKATFEIRVSYSVTVVIVLFKVKKSALPVEYSANTLI